MSRRYRAHLRLDPGLKEKGNSIQLRTVVRCDATRGYVYVNSSPDSRRVFNLLIDGGLHGERSREIVLFVVYYCVASRVNYDRRLAFNCMVRNGTD